jgi:type I restriction enzyme S subunit
MQSNYRPIGDYIQLVDELNKDLKIDLLLGLTINKLFIPSVANIVGTNMRNYKVIRKNQFACSIMQVRRDGRMPVALLQEFDDAIISQAYPVFEVKDENELLPEYLMMWFSRPEFDREACFYAVGGVRGSLEWEDFCNMKLPIPSIETQRAIVTEYNTVKNRITLNNQLIQKLEETAQAIYKQWFVDFEFPDENGKPYKSSGGKMVFNEELDKEIPEGWEVNTLDAVSNCFDGKRRPLSELERQEIKGIYPYYGAMGIVDYINDYLFDGIHLLFSEDGVNVINENGNPSLQYIWGEFWVNNHAHVLKGKGVFTTEILSLALKNTNVSHLVTGAAQPKINQKNMNSIEVLTPTNNILIEIQKLIKPIFENVQIFYEQKSKMQDMLVILLSKLATIKD